LTTNLDNDSISTPNVNIQRKLDLDFFVLCPAMKDTHIRAFQQFSQTALNAK